MTPRPIESAALPESPAFSPEDYARAVINILEDFGAEKQRLETTQRAVLNILEDFGEEKHAFEASQKAVLNILEDADSEGRLLRQMQRAVINILEDLDVEKRSAEEASRMKSEFLANMSHELRTPLNAIMGFAKLMAHGRVGPVSPQHREYLGDILTSSNHLLQLINDVLDLAKVEAGKMEFHPSSIDVSLLVGEVCSILRTVAAAKEIRIETEIDTGGADLAMDPSRLKQVLYNYLSNALKFTPDAGRVVVRVRPEGAELLRVEVADSGIGIEAADIARLFTEFRQLDTGVGKRYQGTGLGLALTRRIVEAQGGSVGVTSAPGKGSTFFALLPRAPLAPADGKAGSDGGG